MSWSRVKPNNKRRKQMINMNRKNAGTIKRIPEYINDVEYNTLLINCRSLNPKINSLVTNMKTNGSTVCMLTETWFQCKDKQLKQKLAEVEDAENIRFLRRDRNSRGGGVAIAYDHSKACLLYTSPSPRDLSTSRMPSSA